MSICENEYICEWTEEGGYDNETGLIKCRVKVHYFIDFIDETFNLEIEDLRKIANLKEDESIRIYGMADYFTVTNRGT